VSSVSASGRSSGKTIITIVLVVIGVLAIVAGIIYFIEPAHSLPSFMGKITHPPATLTRANATRPLHGAAALVAAIVCLVAAFFVNRSNKPAVDGSRDPDAVDARR
jgi:drug/metabolite transporter (DMT)-like permease